MAAAALHRQCGLKRILAALKAYRLDCANGTVKLAPKDAFLHDKCEWILECVLGERGAQNGVRAKGGGRGA